MPGRPQAVSATRGVWGLLWMVCGCCEREFLFRASETTPEEVVREAVRGGDGVELMSVL